MGSSSAPGPGARGGTCRVSTGTGRRCITGIAAGLGMGCGRRSWTGCGLGVMRPRGRRGRWQRTRPWCALTSMPPALAATRPGPAGGSRAAWPGPHGGVQRMTRTRRPPGQTRPNRAGPGSAGPLPRRDDHQDSPARRHPLPPAGAGDQRRAAPRQPRLAATADRAMHHPARPRPPAHPPRLAAGRYGLLQQGDPLGPAPPAHHRRHPRASRPDRQPAAPWPGRRAATNLRP